MVRFILPGLFAEGSTDHRFLSSVIRRTFENIALEVSAAVEISDVISPYPTFTELTAGFTAQVVDVARQALINGISVLCVHADADHEKDEIVQNNKFAPAWVAIDSSEKVCKIIVPVIPVQMTEAWMLADIELLKDQIGSTKNDEQLGLDRRPETIADPKRVIEEAIRIAREDMPMRRRGELKRNHLYQPIGSAISLKELAQLPSYEKFCQEVRQAFRTLGVY